MKIAEITKGFALVGAFAHFALFSSCSSAGSASKDPEVNPSVENEFTIRESSQLIGGPAAQGRVGDMILENDRIRVIVQNARKNAGLNSFGGALIDADLKRTDGKGQDNFGSLFPLVNVEWTVNYRSFDVVSDGRDSSSKVLRASGVIDVYDYLDLDFIGDVAEGITGQRIVFPNRFDDRRNPFDVYDELKQISTSVTTDYTLSPGKNFVKIETTFTNEGEKDAKLPVGQFINGSGQLSLLLPGIGFSPDLMTQIGSNAPAVIYAAYEGSDVSYGYFYDPSQFLDAKTGELLKTTSVSYSGLTGLLFGEEFLKLAPLGGGEPTMNFTIPAGSSRTITGYFVVGNGSAGSVMDAGLAAVGIPTRNISGTVRDKSNSPVAGAMVAVMQKGKTFITYRTDREGRFSGTLPFATSEIAKSFGDGIYKVIVEKEGYHLNGTSEAGSCDPSEVNLVTNETMQVSCVLGETGRVEVSGPVVDAETGDAMPVRLTIVGEDPSPNKVSGAGRFKCTVNWEPQFGIVDVKYITVGGKFDLTGQSYFNLEPGTYKFVITRGPEYAPYELVQEVKDGSVVELSGIALARAARTSGYISSDMHVHSIVSPDSTLLPEMRVLSAAGEGLDVLQSTDHDFVTDYSSALEKAVSMKLVASDSIKIAAGDEVTPNHYGHTQVYPLTPDVNDPEGGAVDWSASPLDKVSPSPDYGLSLGDLIDKLRQDPGDEVIQLNHIMDNPTGILVATGWVTTPFYSDSFGVTPFMSYADPIERRMPPGKTGTAIPIPFGESSLVSLDYDAIELAVGGDLKSDKIFRSGLPTWFNFLNLGWTLTAVADSDSHVIMPMPMGIPRNFIASSIDPRDGEGAVQSSISLDEYTSSIKARKVTVSAGPVVTMKAKGDGGSTASIGDVLRSRKAKVTVEVQSPSWGWFDTIDIFVNTEPIPVDDETDVPMKGTAEDPAKFFKPYHVPRYTYDAVKSFSLAEGTLEEWKEENGVITAKVEFELDLSEDSWVVAVARGTQRTKGFRSLFPFVTSVLKKAAETPENFDPANLDEFHADKKVGAPAWGFTNPIFIDVDGNGFEAKYVRSGMSPVGR